VLAECHEKAVVEPYARICVSAAVAAEVTAAGACTPPSSQRRSRATVHRSASDAQPAETGETVGGNAWKYVLAVAGSKPRKGTIDLVEAYHLLRQRLPDVGLVIGGGETLFDYRTIAPLRAEVRRSRRRTRHSGTLEDDELPSLVAASAAFAFPSTKEGSGWPPGSVGSGPTRRDAGLTGAARGLW